MYRLNGTLQDLSIAKEIGETVAIASFVRNSLLSLLISEPYKRRRSVGMLGNNIKIQRSNEMESLDSSGKSASSCCS